MTRSEPLVFELSHPGHRGVHVPGPRVGGMTPEKLVPAHLLADQPPPLPEVDELSVVRHFVRLSQLNWSIDTGFYPLGSCTMKYNPKINEVVARYAGFAKLHPYQPLDQVQGALELMHDLERCLSELVGLPRATFQPAAGAHGEMTGLMMIRAYHRHSGAGHRDTVLVPDSAHGTNPATAAMMGYKVVTIPSNERGLVSLEALKPHLNANVAALMLTNPSTLGLFEEEIREIADAVHAAGGLLYYDGANLNAIMGWVRPGDMGFDVIHLNLHKTMTTPHGGGGPGAGPVLVRDILVPFLPAPTVEVTADGSYSLDAARPLSIGRVKAFYGHFGMLVRAYAYILSMGGEGLKEASMQAVLNANYLRARLHHAYHVPHDRLCMHEFVLSAAKQKARGANAMAIAKRLIDYGFHPPTVYFPLVVPEAMMIEPTETENLATLDAFADALLAIDQETQDHLDRVLEAPHHTPVKRIDEVRASRQPNLRYQAPPPEKATVGV